jgi:phenylalanyl-tRNA synthetase alpha chain
VQIVERFESTLRQVASDYPDAFAHAKSEHELRAANAKFVGPSGLITALFKQIPSLPVEQRKQMGRGINELKQAISAAFDDRLAQIHRAAKEAELAVTPLDTSLPGRGVMPGRLHPITRTMYDLVDIFSRLGFQVAEGPEIEHHEHNFDKLGFPPDHPATDMQDSFYFQPWGTERLLRTHTSTVQVREMLAHSPPLAVVAPGAVYRRDDDATHSPMFFQLEGFMVGKDISMAHLKGVLGWFVKQLFGTETVYRLRPSYFPFVEPGAELDIRWESKGKSRWLEVLGCGLIHPVVFESVGYDPEEVSGFAFGMGIDRLAMLKYGIDDIRWMYDNDIRFLSEI